jgi:hypothetical protein
MNIVGNHIVDTRSPSSEPPVQTGVAEFTGKLLQLARRQKVITVDLDDDKFTRDRVKHVLLRNERLGSFYARTGLGKAQIAEMSRQQISEFVARAAENAKDDVTAPSELWEPRKVPPKFIMTDL